MKQLRYTIFFLCMLASLSAHAYASYLRAGTYELKGSNPGSNTVSYRGTVTIQPSGSHYLLTWNIGNHQGQTGTGILVDNVLSVAFYDHSKNYSGVISYRMQNSDQLEGFWIAHGNATYGREWLQYKGY